MTKAPQTPINGISRALVIDDHPLFCDALVLTLRALCVGARVETAASLDERLTRVAETGSPDIVLLDLNLPDVNGLDGLLRLRAALGQNSPVIVVSSMADNRTISKALAAGAAAFVPKHSQKPAFHKALSAVRRAAADGGGASTSGVALRGGGEEAAAVLNEKLTLLRNDYDALKREFELKDREHAKMSREINRLEDGLDLTETGRPVTIDLVIKQMSTSDQDELVMSSKLLLDRAKELERSLSEFRDLDEQRVRTIADVVSTLEQRQRELKDKLRDAGLLDDEYDDEKVLRDGLSKYMSLEARAAMGHMLDVDVEYEGPATSPLGKNFYATRTVSWWDRWFGVDA